LFSIVAFKTLTSHKVV